MRRIIIAALALSYAAPALAADTLKPGLYKAQSTVVMKGMPMAMPPQTHSHEHCVTEAQIENSPEEVFKQSEGQCSMSDFKMAGGKLSYTLSCETDQGSMTGQTTGTYSDTGYDLNTLMTIRASGMQIENDIKISAERIGDC